MNKLDRLIRSAIKESMDEKVEELHSMIQDEDWNPQDSPNISNAPEQMSEEDEFDLPDYENNTLDSETGRMIPYEREDEEGEELEDSGVDYVMDKIRRECSEDPESESCLKHKEYAGVSNMEMTESLKGKQKRLDKNKNNKLDAEDFKLLRKSKRKKEIDELDLSRLIKGKRYKYESPSFEDELEYSDEVPDREGDSRMHLFRGKKAGGHLMGDRDVESFVSDFEDDLDFEELGEGIGYYDNIDSDDFHEKTGGMYNPKMSDIEEPEYEDVPLKKRRPVGDIEDIEFEDLTPAGKKESFFGKMKRKMGFGEAETEEGNAFTGALAKARKSGDDEFEVDGKKYETKEGKFKKKNVKESFELTESEMIDLIEQIVLEQKSDKSFGGKKPKGMAETEKAQKGSKKENDDYIKSVTKKFKDYLKDASKGSYETNPKHFPKGNGELAKMEKMAYQPDNTTAEYIDNFTAAGQENLVYDEIHPNEDWIDSNIEGSSKTGNNPEWANAVDTGVNKKRNQIRKDNLLGAVKDLAYNKSPQPAELVKTGEGRAGKFKKNFGKDAASKATKILNQLESTDSKNEKLLSEEFDKIKNLMNYNKTTQ
jgi:hypothetical protein